jgi:hypothetical protein
MTSTGKSLPDTLNTFDLKYSENSLASKEALVTITLKPFLICCNSFISPKMTSMLIVLSCASSMIKQLYLLRVLSTVSSSKTTESSLKIILAVLEIGLWVEVA